MKLLRELFAWRVLRNRDEELDCFITIRQKFLDVLNYRIVKLAIWL